ncbi:hypothetical protein EDC04DRAFT_104601 [Pisolithus marmoratus]|nr:hypothetical protein EDC04DRAFT_104601 [Pisolithus marmoratus]
MTSSTAQPASRCSLPSKWAVYKAACYLLHIALVLIHIVLLLLYKYRVKQNVHGITGSGDIASVGIVIGLLAFSVLYGFVLVWLTQQLALRSNLMRQQTLTETHDKTNAWSGIGAAVALLFTQSKVARGVYLIILYFLGISALHITSSSIMSITLFVPNATASIQYQLTINVTPVSIGLFNSVLLLALSCYMIHSPPAHPTLQLSSCGILEAIWLSSQHKRIQEVIGAVKSSGTADLRDAGHCCTTPYGHRSDSKDDIDFEAAGKLGIQDPRAHKLEEA